MSFCQNCGIQLDDESKFCKECGNELRKEDKFCSGYGTKSGGLNLASLGSRLGSYVIDWFILTFTMFILFTILVVLTNPYNEDVLTGFMYLLNIGILAAYYTYFFGNGQTLGMKLAKIKVCGVDGTYPIGYGKGFLRWIGFIISGLALLLGFLWILIDESKQGWHDKIADTYVVNE